MWYSVIVGFRRGVYHNFNAVVRCWYIQIIWFWDIPAEFNVLVWDCSWWVVNFNCMSLPDRYSWWRHQIETFSALLAICAGNSPVADEFPAQRPATRSFDVFFDLRLSKQSRGWWFEAPSRPLWRHSNECEQMGLVSVVVDVSLVICFSESYCR